MHSYLTEVRQDRETILSEFHSSLCDAVDCASKFTKPTQYITVWSMYEALDGWERGNLEMKWRGDHLKMMQKYEGDDYE